MPCARPSSPFIRERPPFLAADLHAVACGLLALVAAPAHSFERGDRIELANACAPGDVGTLGVLGDLLLHESIQREIAATPEGAQALFSGAHDVINAPDVTVLNLEGTLSCCRDRPGQSHPGPGRELDNRVYSSGNATGINASPLVARDLRAAGVDAVTTANNHAFDRLTFGVRATLEHLDAAGLLHTGTRRTSDEPWHTVAQVGPVRLALLACTQWTNGPEDDPDSVLFCDHDEWAILDEIAWLSTSADVDGVVLLPHAGIGSQPGPDAELRAFAKGAADAGALAVLTNGRHAVQPWEVYRTQDGRDVLLSWALGDVVSDRSDIERTTAMLVLSFGRGTDGRAELRGAGAVPLIFDPRGTRAPRTVRPLGPRMHNERALLASRLGLPNLLDARAPLDVTAACRTGAPAATRFLGAIGDSCTSDDTCTAPLTCDARFHDAACTKACTRDADCPRTPLRGPNRCVDTAAGRRCLPVCKADGACRDGFACKPVKTARGAKACQPAPAPSG